MKDTIVIKIGGVASQTLSDEFINQIKIWQQEGKHLVLVHGGGYAISQLMSDHHIVTKKIDGLRVTAKSDMALVRQALLDQVGTSLNTTLLEAGIRTVQLRDELGDLVMADFLNQERYGYVGEVTQIQSEVIENYLSEGKIPLLASLGVTSHGDLLNINADYLATAVAVSLQADKLILMTDVKGVLENGQVLEQLATKDIPLKITSKVITGGMIPKLESAAQTVLSGVAEVVIGDNLLTGTSIVK